jgi:hypothetical protein
MCLGEAQPMVIPIALFIALHFFGGQHAPVYSPPDAEPKAVTVNDLTRKLSIASAVALFGRKQLLDSSLTPLTDRMMKWHEHFLDSALGRHNPTPAKFTQMVFAPVLFEGLSAKVTILFGPDSSFGATVSIPYPVRLHAPATAEDFKRVSKNIAKSLGEPSVSTEMYIDYMVNGNQSLFGNFRDGVITINLWRLGP